MPFFCRADFDPAPQGVDSLFAKAIEDELANLDTLLTRYELRIRQRFQAYVSQVSDEAIVREVAKYLAVGDVDSAMGVLQTHIGALASVIPQTFADAGVAEAAALAAKFAPIAPQIAVGFDPTNPVAAAIMRQNRLEFVVEFTKQQREATRAALVEQHMSGSGTIDAARAFKDSIGLTRTQEGAVANYRRLLQQGSRQALDRTLRDARFDRSVERAAAGGAPLTPEQIDRMVERYRQRFLAYRAAAIATTEGTKTMNEGRAESFRQQVQKAGIPTEATRRRWNTTLDGRERFTHRVLNGQERDGDAPYDSPSGAKLRYPGDPLAPADEVVGCRCHQTFSINVEALRQAA